MVSRRAAGLIVSMEVEPSQRQRNHLPRGRPPGNSNSESLRYLVRCATACSVLLVRSLSQSRKLFPRSAGPDLATDITPRGSMMRRRLWLVLLGLMMHSQAGAQTITLPREQRPAWVRQDGIVMAGSWEPLFFRVRRDGRAKGGYAPDSKQLQAYQTEHGPQTISRLKEMGVNFVMLHCHKGAGIVAEQQSMQDAVRAARLYHEAGLRVGVYVDSGTLLDLFFHEQPAAKQWVVLNPGGQRIPYIQADYRAFWDRSHPEAQAYFRQITKFAVEEVQADLLHFDNYVVGPGWDVNSIERFQQYLQETFDPSVLRQHGIDPTAVRPPEQGTGLLRRAWLEFSCRSLAESYRDMSSYARMLRPDILVDCNPGEVRPVIRPPVDHGRMYAGGEATWDESGPSGMSGNTLQSKIRTYKVARSLQNMVFAYVTTPLEAAESMAFNLDCLGGITWFEYGQFVAPPERRNAVSTDVLRYVKFFNQRRELFRDTDVVADLAVLRSFPSMVFGKPATAVLTGAVEEKLILNRAAFEILHEHQLSTLHRYRGLVLAGCVALPDSQISLIRQFVQQGGRLCIIGPVATHDEWMLPSTPGRLDNLPSERVKRVVAPEDWLSAARWASGDDASLSIAVGDGHDSAVGLCAEVTRRADGKLVHLVNYRAGEHINTIRIRLAVTPGTQVQKVSLAGPDHSDDLPLEFAQQQGFVTFTVPSVKIYEIAVVATTTSGEPIR